MLKYIKKLIAFISIIYLLYFLTQPLISEKRVVLSHNHNDMDTQSVSFSEMDSFLEVWSQYCQKGYKDEVGSGISIFNESVENAVPNNIRIWLKRREWTVERFYYVEQRLRAALKSAILDQHFEHNKQLLKKGIGGENLKEIVKEQKQQGAIKEVTPEEIIMVRENAAIIDGILNCTNIYKP